MPREHPTKSKRYGHPVYRFSILPPDGWRVMEPGPGQAVVAFVGPPKGGVPPHISIETHEAKGLTLAEYTKVSKARAQRNLKNYVLFGENDRRIGALKGHEVRIGFRKNEMAVAAKIFYTVNGGRLYVVTCMSLLSYVRQYTPAFDKTLNTFKVW